MTRVEQKLNALNPQANPDNLRIYSFRISDPENHVLALEKPGGMKIGSTLSLGDLFSFDVRGGGRLRHNFESLFGKYEAGIEVHTVNLLDKLDTGSSDIKAELIDLFAAKLLNFVRNPFSIVKVLNTFPGLADYDPTDADLLAAYRSIVSGRKPHQAHLCAQLGIKDAQYVAWLRVLFMLLMPMADGQPSFFESVIKSLFEDPKTHVGVFVCTYDNAHCLLSDRGFSQPVADGAHMAFSFNLCARAFVNYIFADPATLLRGKASPEFLARAIAWQQRLPQKQVHVTLVRNDLVLLESYNRRVIEQSRKRVYCSIKNGLLGAIVVDQHPS